MLTKNSTQTKNLAAKLVTDLLTTYNLRLKSDKGATVVALSGELGSGKTTFTQGFARALGIKQRIISPTFLIMRKYQIPRLRRPALRQRLRQGEGFGGQAINKLTNNQLTNFYHVDLYRLEKISELKPLGFKEILKDPSNIVLIEWPGKAKNILPKNTKWIYFKYGKREKERVIAM
jgi:tRNA threonylcarbamoyladenosine biosynthesis protein TsaE